MLRRTQARGNVRREAVIEVAMRLFAEKGFDNTSIPDIIKEAGGSTTTIYNTFKNKEGLFAAALELLITRMFEATELQFETRKNLRDQLYVFGFAYLTAFCEPNAAALCRLVLGEASRCPMLSKMFFEGGVAKSYAYVAQILERHTEIKGEEAQRLAALYVESLKHRAYFKAVALVQTPNKIEIEEDAALATDVFMAYIEKRADIPQMGNLFMGTF